MRNARLAEWILSLVMPPEAASAAAGDLIETSKDPWDLTVALARTVAGFLWRGLLADGLKIAAGALGGWCTVAIVSIAMEFLFDVIFSGSVASSDYWHNGSTLFLWFAWTIEVTPHPTGKLLSWLVRGTVWISLCILTGVPKEGLVVAAVSWTSCLMLGRWLKSRRVRRLGAA